MASQSSSAAATPQLRILTLNVWGLRFISPDRPARIAAITDRLAEPRDGADEYDVVALQELWCESTDWRALRTACADRFPYAKFFLSGAFGSGLAILSRYPILRTKTEPYSLCGLPIHVHHGDWIVAKGAGCATLQVDDGGLGEVDIWVTHTVAAGGEDGPESRRAHRVSQAYELATKVRESAERGRHVICLGDFNSTPPSLAIALLRDIGSLSDAFLATHPTLQTGAVSLPGVSDPHRSITELGVTCDSPLNTWTKGKPLDARARAGLGKRLDYIMYRGPAVGAQRLKAERCSVCFTEMVPAEYRVACSYSDHFGLAATFSLQPANNAPQNAAPPAATTSQTLTSAMSALGGCLIDSRATQRTHFLGFVLALAVALLCIGIGAAGATGWFRRLLVVLLAVVAGWGGTTLFYSSVIWGEWEKRTLRTILDSMSMDLEHARNRGRGPSATVPIANASKAGDTYHANAAAEEEAQDAPDDDQASGERRPLL